MTDLKIHTSGRQRHFAKLLVLVVGVAGLFTAFKILPLKTYLSDFLAHVQSMGIAGPAVLAAVYVVATVLVVPGTILTLGAGFAFGILWGTIAISIGSTLGALCAFLVGRNMARGFVEQKAADYPQFAAIDRAVEVDGFKIVLLTRLTPVIPFNLLNYLFSVTKVRTRDYFLASWIGMLPGTIMYVYLGTAAKNLTDLVAGDLKGGIGQKLFFGVGLIATIAVTVYVTKIARAAIKSYVPEDDENTDLT